MSSWWRRALNSIGLGSLVLALAACGGFGAEPAAQVNGEVITRAELQRQVGWQMDFLQASRGIDWTRDQAQREVPRLRGQVLDSMIDTRLLRQQARQDGIMISSQEVDARSAEIVEDYGGRDRFLQELEASGLDGRTFRRSIEDALLQERLAERHASGPLPDVEVRQVRHVLVESVELAQAARRRLAAGEDWQKVAAEVSRDPATKDRGGDLGYFGRGQMFPTFDEMAFRLKVNELSEPIGTPFGFHILMVVDIRTQRPTGEQIQALRQQAFAQYLAQVRQTATISKY